MSLFQIYYEDAESGSIVFLYVAAGNMEAAIKRLKEVRRGRIVQVFERATYLVT